MNLILKPAETMKCELAAESLRVSGRLRLQVMGWSMMPTIRPGDILEIEEVSSVAISAGAIAVFARGGRLFVHRIVSKRWESEGNNSFIAHGDAMMESDPPFSSSALLGRVRLISRGDKEIRPSETLSLLQRTVRLILRRSGLASRVLARLHTSYLGVPACQP